MEVDLGGVGGHHRVGDGPRPVPVVGGCGRTRLGDGRHGRLGAVIVRVTATGEGDGGGVQEPARTVPARRAGELGFRRAPRRHVHGGGGRHRVGVAPPARDQHPGGQCCRSVDRVEGARGVTRPRPRGRLHRDVPAEAEFVGEGVRGRGGRGLVGDNDVVDHGPQSVRALRGRGHRLPDPHLGHLDGVAVVVLVRADAIGDSGRVPETATLPGHARALQVHRIRTHPDRDHAGHREGVRGSRREQARGQVSRTVPGVWDTRLPGTGRDHDRPGDHPVTHARHTTGQCRRGVGEVVGELDVRPVGHLHVVADRPVPGGRVLNRIRGGLGDRRRGRLGAALVLITATGEGDRGPVEEGTTRSRFTGHLRFRDRGVEGGDHPVGVGVPDAGGDRRVRAGGRSLPALRLDPEPRPEVGGVLQRVGGGGGGLVPHGDRVVHLPVAVRQLDDGAVGLVDTHAGDVRRVGHGHQLGRGRLGVDGQRVR